MKNSQTVRKNKKEFMKTFLLLFALLVLPALEAGAQALTVDLSAAKLTWAWTQGTGAPATEFRMKCGQVSKVYAKTTIIADPLARSALVKDVIGGQGNWFCIVTAANVINATTALESGGSNEVNFFAGVAPSTPTSLQVQ